MKYIILICTILILKSNSFSQNDHFYYDHVYPFRAGFALVQLNEKFGVINSSFEEIIPPILTGINNFDLSNYYFDGLLYGVIEDSTILFDTQGNRIQAFNNPKIYPSRNFVNEKIDSLYISGYNGTLGCEKEDHSVIIPYQYKYIHKGLINHIIAIRVNKKDMLWSKKDTNSISSNHTVIYNFVGDTIYQTRGIIHVWEAANLYFLEDESGFVPMDSEFKTLNNKRYKRVWPSKNLCWVLTDQGWGLINPAFKYLIEPQFNSIYSNTYWTAVKKNNKYGFVNTLGVQITEIEYNDDWTQYVSNDSIIVAYKNDSPIFLNTSGHCIYNCTQNDTILKK